VPVERAKQREGLGDRELVRELRVLQLDAEAFAQRPARRAVAPWRAEDFDLAAIGRRQALQDFDRSRLPGPVRTEQPEAFAGPDRQVEPSDRDDVTEALGERTTADRYDGSGSLSFSGRASCAILSA
jgi:hypothetical protein